MACDDCIVFASTDRSAVRGLLQDGLAVLGGLGAGFFVLLVLAVFSEDADPTFAFSAAGVAAFGTAGYLLVRRRRIVREIRVFPDRLESVSSRGASSWPLTAITSAEFYDVPGGDRDRFRIEMEDGRSLEAEGLDATGAWLETLRARLAPLVVERLERRLGDGGSVSFAQGRVAKGFQRFWAVASFAIVALQLSGGLAAGDLLANVNCWSAVLVVCGLVLTRDWTAFDPVDVDRQGLRSGTSKAAWTEVTRIVVDRDRTVVEAGAGARFEFPATCRNYLALRPLLGPLAPHAAIVE